MDIIGKTFGKWTVIDGCDNNKKKVVCKCECGTEKLIFKQNLTRGLLIPTLGRGSNGTTAR